jgi:hypothetical protein
MRINCSRSVFTERAADVEQFGIGEQVFQLFNTLITFSTHSRIKAFGDIISGYKDTQKSSYLRMQTKRNCYVLHFIARRLFFRVPEKPHA